MGVRWKNGDRTAVWDWGSGKGRGLDMMVVWRQGRCVVAVPVLTSTPMLPTHPLLSSCPQATVKCIQPFPYAAVSSTLSSPLCYHTIHATTPLDITIPSQQYCPLYATIPTMLQPPSTLVPSWQYHCVHATSHTCLLSHPCYHPLCNSPIHATSHEFTLPSHPC